MNAQSGAALSTEAIRKFLTTHTIGTRLFVDEQVDSTNLVAATLARQGAEHGTVVVAEAQTKGRGRLGRAWISPSGMNLYCSILLTRAYPPDILTWLPLLAGVAITRAVRHRTGLETRLKWPNDVFAYRRGAPRKLAGVLAESTPHGIVIGIGLNVNMPLEAFPKELHSIATSLLLETGQPVERAQLLAQLLAEVEQIYDQLLQHREQSMDAYREACETLGKHIRVELVGHGHVEGLAEAIGKDGTLCLRNPDGEVLEIRAGDVVHLR